MLDRALRIKERATVGERISSDIDDAGDARAIEHEFAAVAFDRFREHVPPNEKGRHVAALVSYRLQSRPVDALDQSMLMRGCTAGPPIGLSPRGLLPPE